MEKVARQVSVKGNLLKRFMLHKMVKSDNVLSIEFFDTVDNLDMDKVKKKYNR